MAVESTALNKELKLKRRSGLLKKSIPWVIVVVLAGGGFAYWSTTNHSSATQQVTTNVQWVQVQRGNVQAAVGVSGTLNPAKEYTLTASTPVLSVSVKAGDKVKKGQVIAKADTSSLETQLKQAQAQLASAQAKLAQTEEPTTVSSGNGPSRTQAPDQYAIAQAQASVDQAQAQVDSIQQQIDACTIKSPIAGTVLEAVSPTDGPSTTSTTSSSSRTTSSGATGSSSTVAVIANLDASNFVVSANVSQADIGNIQVGQAATISVSTSGGARLQGKVDSISYSPQSSSGVTTYPITIKLDSSTSSDVKLLPGESASVEITEQQANNVLTLPAAAITQQRGVTGVYVKSAGSSSTDNTSAQFPGANRVPDGLQFKQVTVGLYGGNEVEIKDGLSEGEQVAVVTYTSPSTSSSTSGSNSRFGGLGGLGGLGGANRFGGGNFGGGYRGQAGGGQGFSGRYGGGNGGSNGGGRG